MKGKKIILSILTAATILTSAPVTHVNAGQAEPTEENMIEVESITLQHTHTGSSTSRGGCYTRYVHSDGCGKTLTYLGPDPNAGSNGTWGLYKCPDGHYQTRSVLNASGLHCQNGYFTRYDPECGLVEGAAIGTIIISRMVDDGYYLIPSAVDLADSITNVSYEWSTGENDNCTVTGNGTYILTIRFTESGTAKSKQISHTVSDYDIEPPVITALTPDTTFWTNQTVTITVTATDNYGVSGYRLNAGEWNTTNRLTVTENGTYYVYTKDATGNISECREIVISNIDTTVPIITVNPYPSDWTKDNITVTFSATDNSNDTIRYAVSESGTLTSEQITGTETSCTVTQNGTYYIYAKDLAGNVAKKIFNMSSIDKTAPIIQIQPFTTDWTNQDIRISFSATDNSNDTIVYAVSESDSLTAGEVTGNETSFLVTENGTYYVYAKDLAGNVAKKELTVSNIDKTAPVVTVDEINSTYTNASYDITFSAEDNESGVLYYTVSLNPALGKEEISGTETRFAVTQNDVYYVYAVDKAGNIGKKQVVISNMDLTAPDGNIALTNGLEIPNGSFIWTDKVTAHVSASDNIALADKAYNFDSEGYELSDSKEYIVNGSYEVKIRDHVGNEKEINFSINNIDSTAPTIKDVKYIYADAEGNRVEKTDISSLPSINQMDITFAAEDTQSGLPFTAYRYKDPLGVWSEWSSEATMKTLIFNGDYTIEVRDNCGNVAVKTITLTNLLEKFPVIYLDVNESGEILGSTTRMVKIGQMAAGSEIGIDMATGAYYEGYDYINCDTMIVGSTENIVHRFFKRHYYDVRYYDEGLNLIVAEKIPYGGQATSPEIPQKDAIEDSFYVYEYTFAGWVDKNGNPVSLSNIKKDTVLYPSYKEVRATRTYTVQFIVDGDVYDTQKVTAGSNAETPKAPEKPGYVFSGWDRSYANIKNDLSVYAIFSVNPSASTGSKPQITTQTSLHIPSESDIELLANTEVEYIESQMRVEKKAEAAEDTDKESDELADWVTILNETTPFSDLFSPVKDLYTNEKTKAVALTTTTVAGAAAVYSVISLVCSLIGGLSLTQLLIFGFMLFRKKIRYVRGAWLTDADNIRYVDKYGRSVTAERENGSIVFKRKGKVLRGIDVNDLLERLNLNKISYKEFEDIIASSEVYTSFSKNLEIETWNVKSSHGKTKSKARGFNLVKNLEKVFGEAGRYAVRLTQNGKQTLFEIKYAMESM